MHGLLALLSSSLVLVSALRGQGTLTPPGAPAASMRTLTQVQPRTPLAGGTTGLTISLPGSYYLTGDLTVTTGHAIQITADNVSLDLSGFTLSSNASPASGFGVALVGGRSHVAIANGHIRGTTTQTGGTFTPGGFLSGIDYLTATPRNVRVTNVSVSGTANYGIDLGPDRASVISGCTVRTTSILGLQAGSISDSAALEVGGTNAINGGTVTNSIGTRTVAGGTPVLSTEPTVSSVSAQVTALQTTAGAIESRTRLPGGAPLTISTAGSYYLAGSITAPSGTNAIFIDADNVALDLNGHTLLGKVGTSAGAGVRVAAGRKNIVIRNGQIEGGTTLNAGTFTSAGFGSGISVNTGRNIRIEKIQVSNADGGILVGSTEATTSVEDCELSTIAGVGISAGQVRRCVVYNAGGIGIIADHVASCYARSFSITGIACRVAEDTEGFSDTDTMINSAGLECETAQNCRGVGNFSLGIICKVAINCVGVSNGSIGLRATYSAQNSSGFTAGGPIGLEATLANLCTGSSNVGSAITATIGVSCRAVNGTLNLTNRYLMP